MNQGGSLRSSRKAPDHITDELIDILSGAGQTMKINDIFNAVVSTLRRKKMVVGGEEILRLRIYEKLQVLVCVGGIKKRGQQYTPQPKLPTIHSDALPVIRI